MFQGLVGEHGPAGFIFELVVFPVQFRPVPVAVGQVVVAAKYAEYTAVTIVADGVDPEGTLTAFPDIVEYFVFGPVKNREPVVDGAACFAERFIQGPGVFLCSAGAFFCSQPYGIDSEGRSFLISCCGG